LTAEKQETGGGFQTGFGMMSAAVPPPKQETGGGFQTGFGMMSAAVPPPGVW